MSGLRAFASSGSGAIFFDPTGVAPTEAQMAPGGGVALFSIALSRPIESFRPFHLFIHCSLAPHARFMICMRRMTANGYLAVTWTSDRSVKDASCHQTALTTMRFANRPAR